MLYTCTSCEEDCVFSDIDSECDSSNGKSVPSDIEGTEDEIDRLELCLDGHK